MGCVTAVDVGLFWIHLPLVIEPATAGFPFALPVTGRPRPLRDGHIFRGLGGPCEVCHRKSKLDFDAKQGIQMVSVSTASLIVFARLGSALRCAVRLDGTHGGG